MPKGAVKSFSFNGLRVDRKNTTLGVGRIMPSKGAPPHYSGASVENRIKLGAVLDDFPGTGETGGYQEAVSWPELPALPALVFERDAAARQAAELRLGIAD